MTGNPLCGYTEENILWKYLRRESNLKLSCIWLASFKHWKFHTKMEPAAILSCPVNDTLQISTGICSSFLLFSPRSLSIRWDKLVVAVCAGEMFQELSLLSWRPCCHSGWLQTHDWCFRLNREHCFLVREWRLSAHRAYCLCCALLPWEFQGVSVVSVVPCWFGKQIK